jgi:hypothetical protein
VKTPVFFALLAAAASVGALHSLAPDHWVPFAALARAERWSGRRTALVTILCGLGHVTVSVALGLFGLFLGLQVMTAFGRRMESVAGLLLIGFGVAYALWGLRRAVHRHSHENDGRPMTAWTLFALFSADPCVAVVPLLFTASPLGAARTVAVVAAYESSTLSAMLVLVLLARAGVSSLHASWIDRYGHGAAGAVIAAVGLLMAALGA